MSKSPQSKIIVAMPAYNEEKYIGSLILRAKQHADEVLIVDDGSNDYTAKIAELAGAIVVRHETNKGYGRTIRSILAEARNRNADILVILDADYQHNPDEIPALARAVAEGSDVVIGSREMQENKIALYRRLGQRVLARLTYVASRQKLSDTESGFRAYSRKALNTLELKEEGMSVSSEIVSEAAAKGLKIREIPISVMYTKDGSTLNPVVHGVGVLNRIMVMISERRPLFFFGLVGGILLALGVTASAMVIWSYYLGSNALMTGTALVSILFITAGLLTVFTGVILNVLVKRIGDRM